MRLLRRILVLLGVLLVAGLIWLNACSAPLKVEPLERRGPPPVVDGGLDLAARYAPWIYHQVHPEDGRQDLPAQVDFDGDLDGENAWDNFPYCELVPTAYYAVLETATHWFLTYHLYHPRDWTPFDLGVHLSHENDGENLQVVVEKAGGRVVLLFTQAHFRGGVYADAGSGFGPGEAEVRGPFLLVDDRGVPDPEGRHAAVFVESHGHGIFGALGDDSAVEVARDGSPVFDSHGIVFRPARPGEEPAEPPIHPGGPVPYRLESTTAKLWPLLATGSLVGEGRLVDGAVEYRGRMITIGVPRYYEADRWSGPLGADRGISPFAVDFRFGAGEVGALFFDPAARYAEMLQVPQPWSLDYQDYPFRLP